MTGETYNRMNMGMDFMSDPIMPNQNNSQNTAGNTPFFPVYNPYAQQSAYNNLPVAEPIPDIAKPEKKKSMFTVIPDENSETKGNLNLPAPDVGLPTTKRGRKKKETEEVNSSEIIRANEDAAKEVSSMYNYAQTTALLGDTLNQVDILASELKDEFDATKANRTLKNKFNYIVGLSETIGQLLNTKTTIIREINNSITKAMDLDYKKEKDRLSAEGAANSEKYIMDLYSSFVNNPMGNSTPATLGPLPINASVNAINGDSIVRSPLASEHPAPDGVVDVGYLNYLSRITPEQNAMMYENDPNVQTVVVYDVSNGNKFFQVMNVATGMVVPNVPVLDNRFLEDTVIDLQNKICKNTNLHSTYPLVVINDNNDITSNY